MRSMKKASWLLLGLSFRSGTQSHLTFTTVTYEKSQYSHFMEEIAKVLKKD